MKTYRISVEAKIVVTYDIEADSVKDAKSEAGAAVEMADFSDAIEIGILSQEPPKREAM